MSAISICRRNDVDRSHRWTAEDVRHCLSDDQRPLTIRRRSHCRAHDESIVDSIGFIAHANEHDARKRWSAMTRFDHRLHRIGISGEHRFDATIATIAHPAVEPETACAQLHEGAETDPLHAAFDVHEDAAAQGFMRCIGVRHSSFDQ